jgi:hypothetical protein
MVTSFSWSFRYNNSSATLRTYDLDISKPIFEKNLTVKKENNNLYVYTYVKTWNDQ